jgi:hypothetical protein
LGVCSAEAVDGSITGLRCLSSLTSGAAVADAAVSHKIRMQDRLVITIGSSSGPL